MKSPFPGMDPYLEQKWPTVHGHLVVQLTEALNQVLPDDLVAVMEDRLAIESEASRFGPDLAVNRRDEPSWTPEPQVQTDGLGAVCLMAPGDPSMEHFTRVEEPATGRCICVIEVISPANRTGAGLGDYLMRRDEIIRAGSHVVEIELVREGRWNPLLKPSHAPEQYRTPYRTSVRTAARPARAFVTPILLREPLPAVQIPLRPGDAQPRIELQSTLDAIYQRGAFWKWVDYTQDLDPPLETMDAAWAETRITEWKNAGQAR